MPLSKIYKIYGMVVGMFVFFIPSISFIGFVFLIDGYVPSKLLEEKALYVALSFSILLSTAIAPKIIQIIRNSFAADEYKKALANIAVLLFLPFFGAGIGAMFISFPVSYALHKSSGPEQSFQREIVESANRGRIRRMCSRRARLHGDSYLTPRVVCGISNEAVSYLRNGGWMVLKGYKSKYGFQIVSYSYSRSDS